MRGDVKYTTLLYIQRSAYVTMEHGVTNTMIAVRQHPNRGILSGPNKISTYKLMRLKHVRKYRYMLR